MFSSRHRPAGRPRPGAQRHRSKVVIGVGLLVAIILLANSGGSSHKSHRASERQLADRTLAVQDYGGSQQVAIQQGDTVTVIQQDPDSSRPKLEVHDSNGVQTASKYNPLDIPGISVTKGGENDNTLVHVGNGSSKQTFELMRSSPTDKPVTSSAADIGAAQRNNSQTQATLTRAMGQGVAKVAQGQLAKAAPVSPGKGKSSFHGGGTTLDSGSNSNVTEQASEDQKQAMAATDRQRSSSATELFSSSTDEDHPKDPAGRESDQAVSGAVASLGAAAASAASGLKNLVSNNTEDGCTEDTMTALPQLKLEQVWKPSRSGFDTDVTLVTQLSLESLNMLQAQCELWSGPIAAVAYMPLVKGRLVSMDDAALNGTTVEESKAKLAAFYDAVSHAGPCRMTLELVSEEVGSAQLSSLYPFNALRNHALLLVKTEVVLLLDVDFVPSEELSRIFSARQEYQSTLVYLYNNAVIVLPAFETLQGGAEGQQLALKLAKGSKEKMMGAIVDRQVRQYQVSEYEKGQRATDYTTWLTSNVHYNAKFEEGYEPYIVSARKNVPWYDERFRGHGRDRIVQTLNMAGFVSFAVHPTAYVIQQPHPQYLSTHLAKESSKFTELLQTYSDIRGSILAGRYEPVSAFSCKQGHTSYTAADLPTRNQVSEAAYAASLASAGRLAALTSQAAGEGSAAAALDPAQQLQQAQQESAQQQRQQQVRGNTAGLPATGNTSAANSKSIAAKAAAVSAAVDLQDDTDETAALAASQMPVDVAAQLQQAQSLAQQQAAEFKNNNEGQNTRLDAAATNSAALGATSSLGLSSSSAADSTALSGGDSSLDPAEELQRAQQHQSQQAATFKQNSEGTTSRLDVGGNAAAAAAGAVTAQGATDNTGSEADANVGGIQELGNADAAGSAQASGLAGLGQTALADSAGSASAAESIDTAQGTGSDDASVSDPGATGLTDYAQYAKSEGSTAATDALADGVTQYADELASTGTTATSSDYVQEVEASKEAAISHSEQAAQLQQQASASVGENPFLDAQTLPDTVTVTR